MIMSRPDEWKRISKDMSLPVEWGFGIQPRASAPSAETERRKLLPFTASGSRTQAVGHRAHK